MPYVCRYQLALLALGSVDFFTDVLNNVFSFQLESYIVFQKFYRRIRKGQKRKTQCDCSHRLDKLSLVVPIIMFISVAMCPVCVIFFGVIDYSSFSYTKIKRSTIDYVLAR